MSSRRGRRSSGSSCASSDSQFRNSLEDTSQISENAATGCPKQSPLFSSTPVAGELPQASSTVRKSLFPTGRRSSTQTPTLPAHVENSETENESMSTQTLYKPSSGNISTPSSSSKRSRSETSSIHDDRFPIYESLCRTKAIDITGLVLDWMERYNEDRDMAILDIVKLFVIATGFRNFDAKTLQELNHAALVDHITQNYKKSSKCLLMTKSKEGKRFKENFGRFITELINECRSQIIYDEFLMDHFTSLSIGLANSDLLPLRYVGTLASVKALSCLTQIRLEQNATLRRIKKLQQNKRLRDLSREEQQKLIDKMSQMKLHIEELENICNFMFERVFKDRIKDVKEELRLMCAQELTNWMTMLPDKYLQTSNLRLLEDCLYDKSGHVRLQGLVSLYTIFDSKESNDHWEVFINQTRPRLMAMVMDKDDAVCIQAIKLALLMCNKNFEKMEDLNFESLLELIYTENRLLAQAAGEFLFGLIEQRFSTVVGKPTIYNPAAIFSLVEFSIEHSTEYPNHEEYLVDSLIDANNILKDWKSMLKVLLEKTMNEEQKLAALRILLFSVKQATTGIIPLARRNRKTPDSEKGVDENNIHRKDVTQIFCAALPGLLKKYDHSEEYIVLLSTLPQYFDLNALIDRDRQDLSTLLKCFSEIVQNSGKLNILHTISNCFHQMCSQTESSLHSVCNNIKDEILQSIISKFRETEQNTPQFVQSLRKICAFFKNFDMTFGNIWEEIFPTVEQSIHLLKEDAELLIDICFYDIMWQQRLLFEASYDELSLNVDECKFRAENFVEMLFSFIKENDDSVTLNFKLIAFEHLCDLLYIFCNASGKAEYDANKKYTFKLNDEQRDTIRKFVEQNIFGTTQKNDIEEVNRRRRLLNKFVPLISTAVVNYMDCLPMFVYYPTFSAEYGDLTKRVAELFLGRHELNLVRVVHESLIKIFLLHKSDTNHLTKCAKTLAELLCLKKQESVLTFHKLGIYFALQKEENLEFLLVLGNFCKKLDNVKKAELREYLNKGIGSTRQEEFNLRKPVKFYINGLKQKPDRG